MSNNIVVVNTTVTNAPAPNTLQKTGAFISQGGTTKAAQTLTLLTQLADLTAILAAAKTINSLSWSGSVVTGTTVAPHGWTNGDVVLAVIAGASPSGYNGTFSITITGTSTFTYPLTPNPGSETVPGTVTLWSESELLQMGTTYFAQTTFQAVNVLELGEGTPAEGVTALSTFITANPSTIYSYLVPREWDGVSSYLAFLATLTSPTSKTYFFTTTTVANRAIYTGQKCVLGIVESPTVAATEFSLASEFAVTLNYNPGSTTQVPPLSYAFVYGVTPYPAAGNTATFTSLNTANIGWIGTGAEGGLTTSCVFYGQLQDGNPFNYWYAADWMQLNVDLALSNEIINGSNSFAPLYYNQAGINRLQARAVQVANQAVSAGLGNGTVISTRLPQATFVANYNAGLYQGYIVINAEPFLVNANENPNDYAQGVYRGFTCVFTPLRGFKQVLFQLQITNLIAS